MEIETANRIPFDFENFKNARNNLVARIAHFRQIISNEIFRHHFKKNGGVGGGEEKRINKLIRDFMNHRNVRNVDYLKPNNSLK